MKNLAGGAIEDNDHEIRNELHEAGIRPAMKLDPTSTEVNTNFVGVCAGWTFTRCWYYWHAKRTGESDFTIEKAEELHKTHGQEVRVEGHCACPSPKEHWGDWQPDSYHIESQAGLNAFAEAIKS